MITHAPVDGGSTDYSCVIRVIDSADGTPETSVSHDTSGIDLWYRRGPQGAIVSLTEAALAAPDSAHTDGGVEPLANGYVRVDLPDAAVAAGVPFVTVGGTITDMVVIGAMIPIEDLSKYGVLASGTLQSATATTAVLAAALAYGDDIIIGATLVITGGTGAGQRRIITDYAGASDTATVDTWTTTPDNTSTYRIFGSAAGASLSDIAGEVVTTFNADGNHVKVGTSYTYTNDDTSADEAVTITETP